MQIQVERQDLKLIGVEEEAQVIGMRSCDQCVGFAVKGFICSAQLVSVLDLPESTHLNGDGDNSGDIDDRRRLGVPDGSALALSL